MVFTLLSVCVSLYMTLFCEAVPKDPSQLKAFLLRVRLSCQNRMTMQFVFRNTVGYYIWNICVGKQIETYIAKKKKEKPPPWQKTNTEQKVKSLLRINQFRYFCCSTPSSFTLPNTFSNPPHFTERLEVTGHFIITNFNYFSIYIHISERHWLCYPRLYCIPLWQPRHHLSLVKAMYVLPPCDTRKDTSKPLVDSFKNINTCLLKDKTCFRAGFLQPSGILVIVLANFLKRNNYLLKLVADADKSITGKKVFRTHNPLLITSNAKLSLLKKITAL